MEATSGQTGPAGERFIDLAELLTETAYEADTEGNLTYVNQQGFFVFGYCADDVEKGLSTLQMILPEQRDIARAGQVYILRNRVPKKAEYTAVKKDGSTFPALFCGSPREQDGQVVGIRGMVVDLTEVSRTMGALRRANRKLNLLNSITRHDILNKIAVMMGNLGIARTMNDNPPMKNQIEKLELITRDISDIVTFTRIYQNFGTDEPVWQDLGGIISRLDVPSSILLHNEANNIEIFADLMLSKVFYNLFDNTARHGRRATTITVSAREYPDRLVIGWEDNGTGIPAEDKEKIFERGYGKNTGYGLFLSREILSITEMTIAENGEPGKCCRFEITVPKGAYRIVGK